MNSQLDVLGIFNGASVGIGPESKSDECTIIISVDHLEIPELSLNLTYESIKDVFGGNPKELESRLSREEISEISSYSPLMLVRYETSEHKVQTLALSWEGDGTNSMDYCQIMLFRAFAASRVRSKNNGAPCYGIVGY